MRLEPIIPANLDRLSDHWKDRLNRLRGSLPQAGPYLPDQVSWEARHTTYRTAYRDGAFGFVAHDAEGPAGYLFAARRDMDWTATFALERHFWEILTLDVRKDALEIAVEMARRIEDIAAASDSPTVLIGALPGDKLAEETCRARRFRTAWVTLRRLDVLRSPSEFIASSGPTVRRHSAANVDQLQDLWLALHHHHQASAPELGPYVSDADSWVIHKLWRQSAEEGLLFVAWRDGKAIGLASAAVHTRDVMPVVSDLWATQDRIGETKFLVVDSTARGQGIGTLLMDEIDREFARRGVRDQIIGAIWGNTGAIEFYSSRGYQPGWIEYLKRTG